MIILPAIDLKDGRCVRLFQGDYATAEQVAADPVETARSFEADGARWMHVVDLDGAKARRPVNDATIFSIRENTTLNIEVGGGIRDMESVEFYLSRGVNRVILGSAALSDPAFVREAVKRWGKKIAVVSTRATARWPPRAGRPRARRITWRWRGAWRTSACGI